MKINNTFILTVQSYNCYFICTPIDDFNREILAIEINTSLSGERVIRVLQQVIDYQGIPKQIRSDKGPEFVCKN